MTRIGLCCVLLAPRIFVRMSSRKYTYEEAMKKLNTLQSNKSTIDQIRMDIKLGHKCMNLENMENYLLRTGVTLPTLDQLSVIHVAGTKGKGSTSAMCESVLRHHGFRTGFYSSPHLVAVRERIRLDGRVVSKELFAEHFHQVFDQLYATQRFEGDMPKYFAFLTVLAFNVFLREKVDVAIVEVGIGGIVDYTNVLRKVPVVGITALGLDHTSILGNTLPEIAQAKAGIMKPGCEAYTISQPPEAMDVLQRVAENLKCPLYVAPDYKSYTFQNGLKLQLPVDLDAYKANASLAIQLAHAWMRMHKHKNLTNGCDTSKDSNKAAARDDINLVAKLPNETIVGLRDCRWPGRYQVVNTDYAKFYLDGAHTKESIEICAKWFQHKGTGDKILLFSTTGDRDDEILLKPLNNIHFVCAYFVIPTAYKEISTKSDNYSIMKRKDLIERCHRHAKIWNELRNSKKPLEVFVFECVSDALLHMKQKYRSENTSVLTTGSLYLVGAVLSIIDSSISVD